MQQETIKLLKRLVSIPSYLDEKQSLNEAALAKFLEEYFKKELPGFGLVKIPFEGERANLFFKNSQKIKILFACHLDTVPPSSKDALRLRLDRSKAFGLGAKDMKGGVVSTLLALKEIRRRRGIGVLFYGDEETAFKGIKACLQHKVLFSAKSLRLIISPESRFNLGIGARGIIVIQAQFFGQKSHSARPHLGKDAIKGFYQTMLEIEKKLNKTKTGLGKTNLNIAQIKGGLLLANKSIGMHAGTVPDYLEATLSIRNANPKLDGQDVVGLLTSEAQKYGLEAKAIIKEDYPARKTPRPVINKIMSIFRKHKIRVDLADPTTSGFNDVAILGRALNIPVVNLGPYGEGNHTKDEWVSLPSIEATKKALVVLINEFTR